MTAAGIEHRHIEANGLTFHVAVGGPTDGPPVLCLHGFPEGWMSWRPLIGALPNARVYAPDLRGYPGTTGTRQGYDVLTLTDDIRALISALGLIGRSSSDSTGAAPSRGSSRIVIPTLSVSLWS